MVKSLNLDTKPTRWKELVKMANQLFTEANSLLTSLLPPFGTTAILCGTHLGTIPFFCFQSLLSDRHRHAIWEPNHFICSRGARLYPKNPCFGVRELKADGTRGHFKWETYEQIYTKTLHVGSALAELGFTKVCNNINIFILTTLRIFFISKNTDNK